MIIEGVIERIVFYSEETGYTVAAFNTEDGEITVVGKLPFAQEGKHFALEGEMVYHDSYGEQFAFRKGEIIIPRTSSSIIAYLSSGIFPHIGKKTAERIVEEFGPETISIIEEDPQVLRKIRGLGKKKVGDIEEALKEQMLSRHLIFDLQKMGFTVNQAMKIYDVYGDDSRSMVTSDPYGLIGVVKGIGFVIADGIALKNGIPKNSAFRIQAGIEYTLEQSSNSKGDCFLDLDTLANQTSEVLKISLAEVKNQIETQIIEGKLSRDYIDQVEVVYQEELYRAEDLAALRLIELVEKGQLRDVKTDIEEILSQSNYLDSTQIQALLSVFESKLTIITGGPGTGKTTIVKHLVEIGEKEGMKVLLAAPTGRAAKRLEEQAGKPASTIHRLLKYQGHQGPEAFEHHRENPLEADLIIIDEASMIDIRLMAALMDAVPIDVVLVLVGDVDQLPSVGPGNVLKDLIDSELANTVILNKIYRQSCQSNIVVNAHRINQGLMPILNQEGKDFFFIGCESIQEISDTVLGLVGQRLPDFYDVDPFEDIQVLSIMKKGELGTELLNTKIQERINRPGLAGEKLEFRNTTYALGDKVMQNVNNYNLAYLDSQGESGEGVFNGDIGRIGEVIGSKEIRVSFDDGKRVHYDRENLSELMLSYAITVHKSQGSEFDILVMPIVTGPYMLMTRNLIYTAITRAKKLVVLVGDLRALRQMIENNRIETRNSSLDHRIRERLELMNSMG